MENKIKIGDSDYTRFSIGCSANEFLSAIKYYEDLGYKVKFETNLFRKIFGFGIYKVMAYK